MKFTLSRITKVVVVSALLSASTALADQVNISFRTNGFIIDTQGTTTSAEGAKYVFSKLKFGGVCGTIQKKFAKGQRTNNYLKKGNTCTISGVLKDSAGKAVKKSPISVRNELQTVRATKKTSSAGVFTISFKVLADSPVSYSIVGPTVDEAGSRVGCTIYTQDHLE